MIIKESTFWDEIHSQIDNLFIIRVGMNLHKKCVHVNFLGSSVMDRKRGYKIVWDRYIYVSDIYKWNGHKWSLYTIYRTFVTVVKLQKINILIWLILTIIVLCVCRYCSTPYILFKYIIYSIKTNKFYNLYIKINTEKCYM